MEDQRFFKIDEFIFDTKTYFLYDLHYDGSRLHLGDNEAKLLTVLIREFGSGLDKKGVKKAVWGGDTSDSSLYTCYHNLREIFGDYKDDCLVPRKFRLCEDPTPLSEEEANALIRTPSPPVATASLQPSVETSKPSVIEGYGLVGDISHGSSSS